MTWLCQLYKARDMEAYSNKNYYLIIISYKDLYHQLISQNTPNIL